MIITEQAVKDMINTIEIVEAEIKTATDLFSRAKKYLRETPLTEFDVDYFDENFATPLNNFDHIDFWD